METPERDRLQYGPRPAEAPKPAEAGRKTLLTRAACTAFPSGTQCAQRQFYTHVS